MSLIRFEPLKEFDDLFTRYSPLLGRWPREAAAGGEATQWRPVANIAETDGEFVIKAELPEVKKEDVKVTVENGVITISGERKYEQEHKDEKTHRIESYYGQFSRSFSVPESVDVAAIRAETKDGVLKVRLPKKAPDRPKALEVRVD
jgi:HSP20 family protein